MAISVTFNGATIYKPGAYSRLKIDLGGGFPLGPAGLIAIFGESTQGTPGSDEIMSRNFYTADQLPEIRAKYGSGPIVEACSFLFSPAADAAIPSGASAVYVYKTNASTRSTLELADNYGVVRSTEYGDGANRIKLKIEHTKEVAPLFQASIADTTLLEGETVQIRISGGALQSHEVTNAGAANIGALAAELDAALTGVDVEVDGGELVIRISEDADAHTRGIGKALWVGGSAMTLMTAVTPQFVVSAVESAATITAIQSRDLIQEQDTVGGGILVEIGYNGPDASANISINPTNWTLTQTSGTLVLAYSAYPTIVEMMNEINTRPGWTAKLASTLAGQLSPSILDKASAAGAKMDGSNPDALPARLKRDADAVKGYFEQASLVDLVAGSASDTGLPQETLNTNDEVVTISLAGGTLGATSSASIVNALAAFEEIRVNSVIPLMSRDAIAEIQDGLTDPSSTYTIAAVHQAVKTHCNFMATTRQRSERQGYLSVRASFNACRDIAENLADARLQLCIQDIRQLDSLGQIKWFSPWALSCLLAGSRGGSPVGTPLTNKFMNTSGIRHTAQSLNTPEEDIQIGFNPRTQADQAIISGITFLEQPPTGGFKVLVDNTTYGRDGNWVFNRANVVYAADILSFELRSQLEGIYVGVKNTVRATEVRATVETLMGQFLAQGITVSTNDAPNGYKDLVVRIEGNLIRIAIVAKLVEGIDFILADITVQRAVQEA